MSIVPPPPGPEERLAEARQLKVLESQRTAQHDAQALALDKYGGARLWFQQADLMRARVGEVQGLVGTAAMMLALASGAVMSQVAKQHYKQPRPFELETTLQPIGGVPHDPSYPSGHAAASEAAATVLAAYDPTHAAEYHQLDDDVARARVYSDVHLPSDVAAGANLGATVGSWFV